MENSLPPGLKGCIRQAIPPARYPSIEEIRLRRLRPASLCVGGENLPLDFLATGEMLEELLHVFCGGSIYAYRDTLCQGYLPLPEGARLGIGGQAVTEDGRITGVAHLTSLSIRIPHRIPGVADQLLKAWHPALGSLLICGAPGSGKTTLLRDLIVSLSSGRAPLRVAVVDTRGELCPTQEGDLVDVLRGYGRKEGMEIAIRALNPQVLVCDELSGEDTDAVEEALNCGVPLCASLHARGRGDLLTHPGDKRRALLGGFSAFCFLEDDKSYRITSREELLCGSCWGQP